MANSDNGIRPLAALAQAGLGFLLSTGGAGAGIALLGKEGLQVYGLAIFGTCLLVGLIFFLVVAKAQSRDSKFKEQTKMYHSQLGKLTDLYATSLKDTGGLLAIRLDDRFGSMQRDLTEGDTLSVMKETIKRLRAEVLTLVLEDLRQRRKLISKREASEEVRSAFQSGLDEIIQHWEALALQPTSIAEEASREERGLG